MWTLLYPSTVNKGKTLTLGHWLAEQNMCLTPASRPLLHWVLGTHTGSALFHQTLRPLPWALFPGHHSDITTTSLIGWLPTVQDRWCIFSPSLVALCMRLPSGSRPHSVSRVRWVVCGCGFQCVRGKGVLEMTKRSEGSNQVEHIPSMSKALGWIQSTRSENRKGVFFLFDCCHIN